MRQRPDFKQIGVPMKNLLLFSLLIIICIFGCKDNPSGGGDMPLALSLTVLDSGDNPIAGVDFHYIFYIGYDVVYRNAQIEFSLRLPKP